MSGYVIAKSSYSSEFGIHIAPTGVISSGWVRLSDGKIPRQGTWTKEQLFDREGDLPADLNFKVELLYLGISQNTVRLLYREFTGELLARPAFYYDLTYDMTESKKIVFKTIEMEVIVATNSSITFRIVTDGGLPWMPCESVN